MLRRVFGLKKPCARLTSLLMCLALVLPMLTPAVSGAGGMGDLTTVQPVLVVTGQDIIPGGVYTADNIKLEKSYTLDELKAIAGSDPSSAPNNQYLFSALNTAGTKSFYLGEGVRLDTLLASSSVDTANSKIAVRAPDNYSIAFDPAKDTIGVTSGAGTSQAFNKTRYYYPDFLNGGETGSIEVPSLITWAGSSSPSAPPSSADSYNGKIGTMAGQLALIDYNNPLFQKAGDYFTVLIGSELSSKPLAVGDASYSRAQLLMMPRAERTYTYSSSGGEKTETVRGVPLAELLKDVSDSTVINFHAADDYPVSMSGMTKGELVQKNAVLAYEAQDSGSWSGIYSTAKNNAQISGYFSLYIDGSSPAKMIDSIGARSFANSSYKHITYAGAPYNLDAITGATLTVEGPGVTASTPITVRELESTADVNIHRGVYADGSRGNFSFEGITVQSILEGNVNTNVSLIDNNVTVVFKNRWRQEVARVPYASIVSANTPLIMAYGTASSDETTIAPAPFVFTLGAGENTTLGNGDGPLKLVYDKSEFPALPSDSFKSVAYLYIEEGGGSPGFKHSEATNDAYKNKSNTEYLLTFLGSALGREVNYTVEELEDMVEYDPATGRPKADGVGHRDEYSLSNTTYWYVNEYEGVKLWDLLKKIGLDENTYKDDDTTLVSFSAWDNYKVAAEFSMKQLANPDLFYFYEKSPLDIGTDRPTKEELATEDYQPDNQGSGWTADSNGYPVKKGYPVLLAYGVNGYPYVRNSNLPGYMSGLGNDGGPMRIIYGKTDGLNRSNPSALENYAYFFNNGSNQLQRMQEVYAGEEIRYSTHMENPDYQSMKDTPAALTVDIVSGGTTTTHTFTLEELENILYGVDKRTRDGDGRQEKGYYYYKNAGNGDPIEDLFEGVSLEYLLAEHIGMQGTLGTVVLYSGETEKARYDLSSIGSNGYNSMRGTDSLGMMVAFAKNGYPLVGGSSDSGYVNTDSVTGKTIKNSGGPLMFVRGQSDSERGAQTIVGSGDSGDNKTAVEALTKIVVNLDPDSYAHTGNDYNAYAAQTVKFSGAVSSDSGVSLTIGELETKQKYMVTGSYTVGGAAKTYRGLNLSALLNDSVIGASALMNEVTVKNSSGGSKTLTVADMAGDNVILAYGIQGPGGVGKPLVPDSASTGYDAAFANTGGPIRLIIAGGSDADCITNVSEIVVSAAELDGWKHTSGNFAQYADFELEISGQNLKNNKTYTVAQIEAMDNLIVFDSYQMGGTYYMQGVDLYKLLQNIGFADSLDTSDFTAYASDGYATQFKGNDLKNGINGKPILVAFGQGTSSANGLPLVPETTSPGYDPNIGNAFGPLRLLVNDNSGWCVKYLAKIVVGAAGGNPDPADEKDFNVYGLADGTVSYDIKAIKNLPGDKGKVIRTYTYFNKSSSTDTVKGAYLKDILAEAGVGNEAVITINTTDGYETKQETYRGIPMSEIISKNYFVAYDVGPDADNLAAISDADKETPPQTATVRIYRDYDDGSTTWLNRVTNVKGVTVQQFDFTSYLTNQNGFPNAGVRSIDLDSTGGLWAGTYGGGLAYLPSGADNFTVYNSAGTPTLLTDFASAVAVDNSGGVWFSQNASYTNPGDNRGVGYMKNDIITWYRASDNPGTIPDDYVQAIEIDSNGHVWFGSFGGVTKYDGSTWKTWTKADGLPAASVNTIVFDGSGGVWLGCYPDGAGTQADPFVGGYAHLNAGGTIDFKKSYTADYSDVANSSLLADAWVRGMAVDNDGGVWVVRSGSYANLPNVGGRVDYVDKNGTVTTYTGQELLGGALTVSAANNPEIRVVAVDKNGGLWFGTSGLGIIHCSAPKTVHKVYSTATGAWPSGTAMDNIYYLKFEGDTLYAGGNGGIAWSDVTLAAAPPSVTVLNPPFTIKGWGQSDIEWVIGGSGNSIKNMPDNKGKAEKDFQYNGNTVTVRGALLSDILDASGISGNDVLVTIETTDGFSRDNYKSIPLADIAAEEYFVAYDIKNGTGWDKVEDVDKNNVQASLRIYRKLDDGSSGNKNNEIKGISGITISKNTGGETPGGEQYIGDATPETAALSITGAVSKPGYFTANGLASYTGVNVRTVTYNHLNSYGTKGSSSMTGVYLEDLLKNVMTLNSNAESITVTAGDGYYRSFNLDSNELGVYWTDNDGNKIMLAWQENGTSCSYKLVVGQTDEDHVNRPMWVSDIVSITVNAGTVSPGGGTPGSYEGGGNNAGESDTAEESGASEADVPQTVTKSVDAEVSVENGTASATTTANDLTSALNELKESAQEGADEKAIVLNASTNEQTGKTEFTLPADALGVLTGDKETSLILVTDQGSIELSPALLEFLSGSADGPLTILIETSDASEAGGLTSVDITISIGDTTVGSFNQFLLKADIPVTPEEDMQGDSLVVYYVDDNGNKTIVKLSAFSPDGNTMRVGLQHLSKYMVAYQAVTFADIQTHWAKSHIEFLAAREIVNGVSADAFNPNGNVTRAEFVKMLAECVDGVDIKGAANAGFSDIPKGAWYAEYVNWAAGLGITQGYPDGTFQPDGVITREQMSVMTSRFISAMKYGLKPVRKAAGFTDQEKISSFAETAIKEMQQYGILDGDTDGAFNPGGTATRGEAAKVIKTLIEAILR